MKKREGVVLQKRRRVESAAPLRFRVALPDVAGPVSLPPPSKNKRGFFALRFLSSFSCLSKVVIIGAGTAGLSAAKSIAELSAEVDVVVLEGRGRVGGRIDTLTLQGGGGLALTLFF
jgi:NADPH-dependent 2,4-dienoyl-CoA reductase/sulfur reductase-like enzyme